ncbi:HD domain-containing phosphohydrolase [Elusimicrobiota bacterium]
MPAINNMTDRTNDMSSGTQGDWKHRLYLILKLSSKINSILNVKEIIEAIAEGTKEILESERCTVFLLDSINKEIFSWVALGMEEAEIRFPIGKGLAGYVADSGETLNISDVYKDKRFNPEIDKKTGYRTKNILCMPMRNQKARIIGVFAVLNKKEENFTIEDEEVLGLLSKQAAAALESAQLYEELKKSFDSFINTLAETIDARDPMTAGHSRRVSKYSLIIAEGMGYSAERKEALRYASMLHDLGKIGVRESILVKPDQLLGDEYEQIKSHATITRKILELTYFSTEFKDIPLAAASHHESMDGTGYPQKLKGDQIPEMARIIAVADVFDALTYTRRYRKPMSMENTLALIRKDTGTKFDPGCVEAFLKQKVYDVLKILNEGEENEVAENSSQVFGDVTLGEIDKIEDIKVVEEFNKYYTAGIS